VLRQHVGDGQAAHALVVDDDPGARELLRRTLEQAGWTVDEADLGLFGRDSVVRLRAPEPAGARG
jgi:DNA-binding response OmpR family regulator